MGRRRDNLEAILYPVVNAAIQLLCLAGVALGSWMLFAEDFKKMLREEQYYSNLIKSAKTKKSRKSPIVEHIYSIFCTIGKKQPSKVSALAFILVSLGLFFFSILIMKRVTTTFYSTVSAVLISAIPYVYIRLKLRTIRVDSSYEGDLVTINISNEYKQHYFNMQEAIDICAKKTDIGAYSKRNLYRLSLALKSYQSEEELDEIINNFVYAYDTEWAVLLGTNIKVAIHYGRNVCSSLNDIIQELKIVKQQNEQGKRFNNEAFAMIRFLLIPLYLGSVYMAVTTFGFTMKKFIEYQFINPAGLRFAIVTFLSIILSMLFLSVLKKPKYDI